MQGGAPGDDVHTTTPTPSSAPSLAQSPCAAGALLSPPALGHCRVLPPPGNGCIFNKAGNKNNENLL